MYVIFKLHRKRASRLTVQKHTRERGTSVRSRQLHITFKFVRCNFVCVCVCACKPVCVYLSLRDDLYICPFLLSHCLLYFVRLFSCHHELSLLSFCSLLTTLFLSLCAMDSFHHPAHLSASLCPRLVTLCQEQDAVVLQSCGDRNVCQPVVC